MELNTIETFDLIRELKSRGYITDLLFCRADVDWELKQINEQRVDDEETPVELDEMDKDYILESLNTEWHICRINERIHDAVNDYIKE